MHNPISICSTLRWHCQWYCTFLWDYLKLFRSRQNYIVGFSLYSPLSNSVVQRSEALSSLYYVFLFNGMEGQCQSCMPYCCMFNEIVFNVMRFSWVCDVISRYMLSSKTIWWKCVWVNVSWQVLLVRDLWITAHTARIEGVVPCYLNIYLKYVVLYSHFACKPYKTYVLVPWEAVGHMLCFVSVARDDEGLFLFLHLDGKWKILQPCSVFPPCTLFPKFGFKNECLTFDTLIQVCIHSFQFVPYNKWLPSYRIQSLLNALIEC